MKGQASTMANITDLPREKGVRDKTRTKEMVGAWCLLHHIASKITLYHS